MKVLYYLAGVIPILLCLIIVGVCIPIIVIGEIGCFVSVKFMDLGDRLDRWVSHKMNLKAKK